MTEVTELIDDLLLFSVMTAKLLTALCTIGIDIYIKKYNELRGAGSVRSARSSQCTWSSGYT